jgi:hypothetical protein
MSHSRFSKHAPSSGTTRSGSRKGSSPQPSFGSSYSRKGATSSPSSRQDRPVSIGGKCLTFAGRKKKKKKTKKK